jgi:hypothetical protein
MCRRNVSQLKPIGDASSANRKLSEQTRRQSQLALYRHVTSNPRPDAVVGIAANASAVAIVFPAPFLTNLSRLFIKTFPCRDKSVAFFLTRRCNCVRIPRTRGFLCYSSR